MHRSLTLITSNNSTGSKMRSTIIAAALALSVSALPSPKYHDLASADALVARAPQFDYFKGRGGSNDNHEDKVPAWVATISKSSSKGSSTPPRRRLSLQSKPKSDDREVDESPRPKAAVSGSKRPSWLSRRPAAPSKGNRPPPKSVPWSPPKAQQSRLKPSGPPPSREPPFPDAEEDDEKIKAVNRMQREPNAWLLDQ